MTSNLEVVITAKDEASAKLKDIEDISKKIGIGFAAAGTVIEGALTLTVKAAEDAQEKMSQFDNMLKNTAKGSAPEITDALKKAADATLKLGFDNEDAALSLAKFYSRTNDVTEAQKLNIVAMDLARQKNLDLSTATTLVNQVLSGNGRVLKQYGINLKEAGTPLEALNELHEKTKGSAEAFSKTFVGQQEIMKQSLQELEENIGGKLLPILSSLFQKLVPIIDGIKNWADAHPELTKNIVLITAVIGGLMLALAPLLIALPGIIAFFGLLSPTVLLVIGVLGGLILIIHNVMEIFDLFKNHSKEIWDGIKIIFKESIDAIVGWFQPFISLLDNIINKVKAVGSAIGSVVGKSVSAVGSTLSNAYSSVANFVTGARAQGGNVSNGSSYIVGENGAEVFTPGTSGYITSNNSIGGGNKNININISGAVLTQDAARVLGDMIIKNLQRTIRV